MTLDFNKVLKVSILEPTQWSAWDNTIVRLFTGFGWESKAMPYCCIMVCNEKELT
jgi:hypothetical protein